MRLYNRNPNQTSFKAVSPVIRFSLAWIPEPNTGCWLWMGSLNHAGYGWFWDGKRNRRAHRYSWELVHGDIPTGLYLDHACRVRSCVNPDHLRLVTPKQNSIENSLSITASNAAKTHCSRCGGEYTLYQYSGKRNRVCNHCNYLRARRPERIEIIRAYDRAWKKANRKSRKCQPNT